jgi:cytochrome c oxidase assembly protein Cox11
MRESYNHDLNSRMFEDDQSEHTVVDEEVISECDYIVLGYVRVPLLQLITKNNGVDGDFTIFDEFKQKMGSLRLRITLNHHNSQRPLYSTSSKIPNQVTTGIM